MIKGLSEKLQKLRTEYGYSQKQVAEKLGISPSIVSAYETGERTPSTDILLSLSNIFHCSTDYLFGKEALNPKVMLDVEGLTSEQIQAIQKLIDTIKDTACN